MTRKIEELVDMGDRAVNRQDPYEITEQVVVYKPSLYKRIAGFVESLPFVPKKGREWSDEDIRDFMSDFHNVNMGDLNRSTHEVFKDQYDVLISQNVGRVNAELMAAGIEWYLDQLARKLGGK